MHCSCWEALIDTCHYPQQDQLLDIYTAAAVLLAGADCLEQLLPGRYLAAQELGDSEHAACTGQRCTCTKHWKQHTAVGFRHMKGPACAAAASGSTWCSWFACERMWRGACTGLCMGLHRQFCPCGCAVSAAAWLLYVIGIWTRSVKMLCRVVRMRSESKQKLKADVVSDHCSWGDVLAAGIAYGM